MRHVVAFSGGFDSTLLLYHIIKNKEYYGVKEDDKICVASVSHVNCGFDKNIRERDASGTCIA